MTAYHIVLKVDVETKLDPQELAKLIARCAQRALDERQSLKFTVTPIIGTEQLDPI